jgi:hypothetical protein
MLVNRLWPFGLMVALFAAAVSPALAEQSWGWDIELQGGFLWRRQYSPVASAEVVEILPVARSVGTETITPSENWTGRASVRRRLGAELDVGLAYTGIGSTEAEQAPASSLPVAVILPGLIQAPITAAAGFALDARSTAQQHIVDLDVGFGADGAGPKLFAGVRFTHFTEATRLFLPQAFFPVAAEFSHRRDDRFIGAGPRLGLRWTHALAEGWSVVAGVEGSILFGTQRFRTTTTGFGGVATGAYNEEHGRIVYNAQGDLAVKHAWTNGVSVAVGYQAAAWFGLRDNRRELDAAATLAADPTGAILVGGGRRYPIDLTHGPYLRVGLKF